MGKAIFKEQLIQTYESFVKMIDSLEENEVIFSANGKWNPLQHTQHLTKSIKLTSLSFSLPSIFMKVLFGKSKYAIRSYEQICALYDQKLQSGAKADLIYHPKSKISSIQRNEISSKLLASIHQLVRVSERFDDNEFNTLRLPHPILGKITFNEMLFFTNYHAICHRNSIEKMLGK
jgi:hypothetical protein